MDNGSTDDTPGTVASFGDRLPIRRIHHQTPGLSNARNAGAQAARGAVIIWTDDDLVVDAHWLRSYLDAFAASPEAEIFGGRAVPRYQEPVTAWFRAHESTFESLLAIRDHPEWDEITPGRVPYGLNYAVRADLQRRYSYDPALGVAPGRRLGGEETTMIRAALADGASGRWIWSATVHHLIPPERQSAAYVFSYYRAHGMRFPDFPLPDSTPGRLLAGLRVAGRILRKGLMTLLRRARGNDAWVRSYIGLARSVGTAELLFASLAKGR